jgi:Skp family chaperone for outer membrane proteins
VGEVVQIQSEQSQTNLEAALDDLTQKVNQLQRQLLTTSRHRERERQATISRVVRAWRHRHLLQHASAHHGAIPSSPQVRAWRHRHLAKAYAQWLTAVDASKRLLSQAAGHWLRHGPQMRAWSRWRAVYELRRYLHESAATLIGKLAAQLSAAVIRAWREIARDRAGRRRGAVASAVALWAHKTISFYFYPWRSLVRRDQRAAALRRRALRVLASGMLASHFFAWADYRGQMHARRESTALKALARMRAHVALKCMHQWHRIAAWNDIERQQLIACAAARFHHRLQSLAWEGWRSFLVDKRRTIARAARACFSSFLAFIFGRWRALYGYQQKVAQRQWLVEDLRLVGVGWLGEALDVVLPQALPRSLLLHVHGAPATARGLSAEEALDDIRRETLDEPPAAATSAVAAAASASSSTLTTIVPHPPAAPRAIGGALGARRPPAAAAPAAAPSSTEEGEELSLEGTSSSRGSAALSSFGAALEAQLEGSRAAQQALAEELRDARARLSSSAHRMERQMHQLQQLQLKHARQTMAEVSQREIEARSAHEQLDAFAVRFAELEEHCFFLKETLYSLLSSRTNPIHAIAVPSTKKAELRPLKAHSARRVGDAPAPAPWNTTLPEKGPLSHGPKGLEPLD